MSPTPVKILPNVATARGEYAFNAGPVIKPKKDENHFNLSHRILFYIFHIYLPEKFNATLFRFITRAAPNVP